MARSRLTRFGFQFGAAKAERVSALPGGRVVIGITTDTGVMLDIYVSRTGRSVRVYKKALNGTSQELTPKGDS